MTRRIAGLELEAEGDDDVGRARFRVGVPGPDADVFAGHFPGAPLLLGVAQVALVEAALAELGHGPVRGVPQLRFRRPVLPGATLRLELTPLGEGAWRVELREGSDLVLDARVTT